MWRTILPGGVLAACLMAGCGSPPAAVDDAELLPVTLPDLSSMHEAVQAQLRDAHAALEPAASSGPGGLADAYGRLGMLLMAGEFLVAAEACLVNARRLAPDRFRWAYYLGHLYERRGDLEEAVEAFRRALEIEPGLLAAQVNLGLSLASLGHFREALDAIRAALKLKPGDEFLMEQLEQIEAKLGKEPGPP